MTQSSSRKMPLPNRVMTVRFSPDERTLLASCWGGQTGAWQPLTGEQRGPLKGPPEGFAGRADMLLGTALSADGKKAALVDAKGVLHVWDPATAKVYCRISEPLVGEDQADFSVGGSIHFLSGDAANSAAISLSVSSTFSKRFGGWPGG